MAQPVIGISCGELNQWMEPSGRTNPVVGCPEAYSQAVILSGAVPVLLPPLEETGRLAEVIGRIDGLLLSGGGDVDSQAYGQERHRHAGPPDVLRDRAELAMIRLAMQAGRPILGICRGLQVLNVALGGSLIQDIPSRLPQGLTHNTKEPQTHSVTIQPGSQLHGILGLDSLCVNSRHHQAIDRLGDGLRVNCQAPDGVIEGVEVDGRPILALQCHPEDYAAFDVRLRAVFDWLARRSAEPGR